MKALLVILAVLLVSGCYEGGTCKDIQDKWTSTVDQEEYDFTGMSLGERVPFSYIGEDGTVCGESGDLHATIDNQIPDLDKPCEQSFNYYVTLEWDTTPSSSCAGFDGMSSLTNHFVITFSCNKFTACSVNEFGTSNCKEFR